MCPAVWAVARRQQIMRAKRVQPLFRPKRYAPNALNVTSGHGVNSAAPEFLAFGIKGASKLKPAVFGHRRGVGAVSVVRHVGDRPAICPGRGGARCGPVIRSPSKLAGWSLRER